MKKICVHLFSNGEDAKDFLLDRSDYVAAINRIAICKHNSGCEVLAFSLMDTHVHLLLYGTLEQIIEFKTLFTKLSNYRFSHRECKQDAKLNFGMYEVSDYSYLKNLASYVIIQCTKDGKNIMFYDYKWGTGSLYFRPKNQIPIWCVDDNGKLLNTTRFGDFSIKKRYNILCSKTYSIPKEWLVCDGIILPTNYVNVQMFESIHKTCNAYRCFMANSSDKDKMVQIRMADVRGVNLSEEEAREKMKALSYEMFGKRDVRTLDTIRRISLAKEFQKRFKVGLGQIARRVYLPEDELLKYLR